MRKAIIGVGIFIILIVVAGLLAPSFIDVNHYRPQIESKLRDRLGRNVSLGPMRLSLIPLGFRVQNAVIADDPKFNTSRPFAQVQTFSVNPEILPLLHHDIVIKSVQLDHPIVELVRNQQGVWNFSTLAANEKQPLSQNTPGEFSLDQLKIYDGQIAITDYQQAKPRSVYDHIDLVLSDFAPDKPFSVDVRAHMPGAGEQVVALRGDIGPIQRDAPARTPFDGRLELTGASLSGLQRFLNAEALANSDAVITGSAQVKNDAGKVASTGKFDIQHPRIHGVDIGYPIAIDYQVNGNLNESKADIQHANLKLGSTPISLQGSINAENSPSKPAQVDMTVKASNVSIAETAKLAAAFGTVFNAANNVSGNLNLDVHAQGPITKPVVNGNVEARNLNISGGELREPVQIDAIQLALSPDAIQSNEFTAKTGHTSASAQFKLLGYSSDAPKIDAKLNTGNADVQELLRIAHAYGISAVQGVNGSGTVMINAGVNGPINEPAKLTYSGTGAVRNVSVQIPSVAKPVGVRIADLQFTGGGVNVNNLDANVGQTTVHGNLTATNFSAPQVQFALAANTINVAELEQLFKAQSQAQPPARPNTQVVKVEPKQGPDESLVSRLTGTGSLTADTVVYDELTLKNVRSTVVLDHGVITVKPLNASLYNGQELGTVVVNMRSTPPTYTVDSKLQDVDANQLLSAISPVKQTLYGLLSANADTHFTTTAGAQSILPTLNGKVSINLKDGKIANVDLLHELSKIAQFQRSSTVEPATRLVLLTGDFDIRNGVAQTNNLKATIDAGSVAAQGTVDLGREALNLHLTVVLSQGLSQTVGGSQIGGFLNTALANNKGELVIPVLVSGTFHQPVFAPDLEGVAQMKLKNLVPNLDNPAALTEGILGQILRGKPTAPQEQQQQQQQTPAAPDQLKNLFDLFQNKK